MCRQQLQEERLELMRRCAGKGGKKSARKGKCRSVLVGVVTKMGAHYLRI
jgi:hypothetical protein